MSGTRMNQFYKTKICPWYFKGRCERGHLCRFAHGEAELRNLPNLFCTSLCPDLVRLGHCPNSETCRFAHSSQQLRATDNLYKTSLCFHWMKGRCEAGSQCRHAHGHTELRVKPASATTNGVEQRTGTPPLPPTGTADSVADWAALSGVPVPPLSNGTHNFQGTGTPVGGKAHAGPYSKMVENVVMSQIVDEYCNGASLATTKAMIDAALAAASNVAARHASAAAAQNAAPLNGGVSPKEYVHYPVSPGPGVSPTSLLAATMSTASGKVGHDQEVLVDVEMRRRQQLLQQKQQELHRRLGIPNSVPAPYDYKFAPRQQNVYNVHSGVCTNTPVGGGSTLQPKLLVTPEGASCCNCSCTGAKSTAGNADEGSTIGRMGRLSGNRLGVATSPNRTVSADIYAPRTRDPQRDASSGPSTPHGAVSCMTAPEVSPVFNPQLNLLELGDSLNELTNRLSLAAAAAELAEGSAHGSLNLPVGSLPSLFDDRMSLSAAGNVHEGFTSSPGSIGNVPPPPPLMPAGTHHNGVLREGMLNGIYRSSAMPSPVRVESAPVSAYHSQAVSEAGSAQLSTVQSSPVSRGNSEPVSRVNSEPTSAFVSNIEESPMFEFPAEFTAGNNPVPELDVDISLRSSVDAALLQLVTDLCLQLGDDTASTAATGTDAVSLIVPNSGAVASGEQPKLDDFLTGQMTLSSNKTPRSGIRTPSDSLTTAATSTTSSTPMIHDNTAVPHDPSAFHLNYPARNHNHRHSLQLLSPTGMPTAGAHPISKPLWGFESEDAAAVKKMDSESKAAVDRSLTPLTSCSTSTAVSNINSCSSNYLRVVEEAAATPTDAQFLSGLVSARCSSAVDECDSTTLPPTATSTFNNTVGHHNAVPWDPMTT